MKTFDKCAAQGDVMFRKIDTLPEGLIADVAENGQYTIAHSETGHNHVMAQENVQLYKTANDNFVAYLVVNNDTPLIHMRSHDTHESIMFKQGIYEIRRQREYVAEGFRRAQD